MLILLFQYCGRSQESCGWLANILTLSSIRGSNLLIIYLIFMHAYNLLGSSPTCISPPILTIYHNFSSIFIFSLFFLLLIFKFNAHWNHLVLPVCVDFILWHILTKLLSLTSTHYGAQETLKVAPSCLTVMKSWDYILMPPGLLSFFFLVC